MESMHGEKPPVWFHVVAGLLLLWGLAGAASFYFHMTYDPAMDPAASEWDRAFFNALPMWLNLVYAIAVFAGLLGSIALLARKGFARPLYIVSLIAVVAQFGYVFGATDLLAHKGAGATIPFPLFIAAMAVIQIWFAGLAQRRGWIS